MESGLRAGIFRIGLLTGRYSDGKFQYNMDENAYYRRLKSIFNLKCLPRQVFEETLEFTPVDSCARALVALLKTTASKQLVYHLYNHRMVKIQDFIKTISSWGIEVEGVSLNEFMDRITSLSKTEEGKEMINGIVTDVVYGGFSFTPAVQVDSQASIACLKEMVLNGRRSLLIIYGKSCVIWWKWDLWTVI